MKTLSTFILFTIVLTTISEAQERDTLEWTVVMGETKAGFYKKWKNDDGSFTERYQYNDRGRGDSTVSNYRYDDEGYLVFIDAKGIDYFKKPVFEKYSLENGVARWENNSEHEEKKALQKAEYVPLKISSGTSYQNYFHASNKTINHFPTGSSKLDEVHEHLLPDGKKIRLVSIAGRGFIPSYSWIDDDMEFFAYTSDWYSLIRKGHEGLKSELLKIQNRYKEQYFNDLTKSLNKNKSTGLAIINATIFDPNIRDTKINSTILIENGVITEVSTAQVNISEDFTIIDAKSKFVMPGLWDMHTHYDDATTGLLNLACGVTNVRDMGNSLSLIEKKKDIDNGTALGPRIQIMSGFIDGAGEYAGPTGEKINSLDEGKEAIKKYADLGYQQIKLYSSIKPEWVKPLSDEAKKLGLRVSGHIPAYMTAEEAILAGYDEIQHTNMLFLNFYGKELDTRTPLRFTTVAEKAADFDFESEEFKNFVELIKERGVTIDPTVTAFEGMFMGQEGKTDPSFEATAHRFPLDLQRSLKSNAGLAVPEGLEQTYKNSYANMLRMVKELHDHGVTIVPGTDGLPGFILHRELENYVKAGIPNNEVLKMATLTSAMVANKADDFGSIEKNRNADIIIIDGDPTKNIQDIRNVEIVIKDNELYYTKDIFEKISIKYFK